MFLQSLMMKLVLKRQIQGEKRNSMTVKFMFLISFSRDLVAAWKDLILHTYLS